MLEFINYDWKPYQDLRRNSKMKYQQIDNLYATGLICIVHSVKINDYIRNIPILDRKSTRLNSSHRSQSRMPSSA